MTAAAITVSHVSHRYRRRQALDDVSIEFGVGLTTLLGVNGAGKTTLLRLLAGEIRPPSAGRITANPGTLRPGIMPQFPAFIGRLRAVEYVEYCGWLSGCRTAGLSARALTALEMVSLRDRADSKTGTLSGGMLRRLALAATLVSEPSALLLDEPLAGLDPVQRAEVGKAIVEVAKQALVVMSTHAVGADDLLGDRIVLLNHKTVAFDGDVGRFVSEAPGAPSSTTSEAFRAWTAERST